jgi:hypothetical protein
MTGKCWFYENGELIAEFENKISGKGELVDVDLVDYTTRGMVTVPWTPDMDLIEFVLPPKQDVSMPSDIK